MSQVAPVSGSEVLVGTAGVGAEARASARDLTEGHLLVSGSSGAGKTMEVLSLLTQLVRERPSVALIAIDPKGDLVRLVRFLAALVPRLPESERRAFLSSYRLVQPFKRDVPLNLLAPQGAEPDVQAIGVLDAIEAATGSDIAGFDRMSALLGIALSAGIQARLSLVDIPKLLTDAGFRRDVLTRVPPGYAKDNLESRVRLTVPGTIGALAARFDRLFASSLARRLLATPDCFSWRDRLQSGVTIVDLSEPPQGQAQLTRLFGSFLLASLSTALLAREVNERTEPLVLALDELPELLTKRVTSDLERLLALVRHRRVALWMMVQDEAQLSNKSAALWPIIQANVRRIIAFRGSLAGLRWLEPFLPPPRVIGRRPLFDPVPSVTADYSRRMLASLAALPNRTALFVDRASGQPGTLIATPAVDMAQVEREASNAPPEVRRVLLGEGETTSSAASSPHTVAESAPARSGRPTAARVGRSSVVDLFSALGTRTCKEPEPVAAPASASPSVDVPPVVPPAPTASVSKAQSPEARGTPARFVLGWWPLSPAPGAMP